MRRASPGGSGAPAIAIREEGETLALEGALDVRTLTVAGDDLARRLAERKPRAIDLGQLSSLDTPGALLLCRLSGDKVKLTGARADHQALLDLVCKLELSPLPVVPSMPRWRQVLVQLGKATHEAVIDARDILVFLGHATSATLGAFAHPRRMRPASISRQISDTGIDALPIIALMAVMIGIVIAYQSVVQLRAYGGENFTINLVAVSVLREMGVLITAIMVAGRSGSAFTAEIGVMKAREEIDALRTMGLDPMQMLVVPRIIGLVITLPLLTFFADAMGLFGGAMVTDWLLNVSPSQFFVRVHEAATSNDFLVGILKAPVFAAIIATIGCMHGMRVEGSAESVGRETTRAVVKSIFLVIVLDAFFSIFFEKVGM
jgi:phospholipid/cholesterol/gamma-HCH transport system permease protein